MRALTPITAVDIKIQEIRSLMDDIKNKYTWRVNLSTFQGHRAFDDLTPGFGRKKGVSDEEYESWQIEVGNSTLEKLRECKARLEKYYPKI